MTTELPPSFSGSGFSYWDPQKDPLAQILLCCHLLNYVPCSNTTTDFLCMPAISPPYKIILISKVVIFLTLHFLNKSCNCSYCWAVITNLVVITEFVCNDNSSSGRPCFGNMSFTCLYLPTNQSSLIITACLLSKYLTLLSFLSSDQSFVLKRPSFHCSCIASSASTHHDGHSRHSIL